MGTTEITYSDGADVRTTQHADPASAWDMLATYGRQCAELGAAIEEAAATGYALQTATFVGDDDGERHTVIVADLDAHGEQLASGECWTCNRDFADRTELATHLADSAHGDPSTVNAGADDAAQRETEHTERRRSYYAMRRPMLESSFPENVVTQGDADYCRDFGHAFHTVDGVDSGTCPRCGNVTPEVYDASRAILRGTKVEYLHIGTQTWRRATVESFRASDAAYVLRTAHGTDAAPARHVHTLLPSATVEGPACAACGDATCRAPDAHHTVTELPRAGATLGAPVLAVGDAVNYHAEHSHDWKAGTVKAVSIGLQAVVITTPDGGDDVALLRNVHRLDTNNGETVR